MTEGEIADDNEGDEDGRVDDERDKISSGHFEVNEGEVDGILPEDTLEADERIEEGGDNDELKYIGWSELKGDV